MHSIEKRSYNIKISKEEIYDEINDYVKDESDNHGGLYNDIRWIDKTFLTREEADEYLEENDKGKSYHLAYDNLAVKYNVYDITSLEKTEKFKNMKSRLDELHKELDELTSLVYMDTIKSEFVTCKGCGSKIASKHWKSNSCPVCRADFRSDTFLARIENKRNQIAIHKAKMDELVKEFYKKSKPSKTMWLVKFKYHC